MKQTFSAVIQILGINPYVRISPARAKALKPDWRKPMPVLVRVNGHPEKQPRRINMMPIGDGGFYLYLHEVVRKASKTGVGDKVKVEVEFDSEYRNGPPPLPAWFKNPLGKNRKAKEGWEKLPPSRQKEIVRHLGNLKSDEAKARNLEKVLRVLSGEKGRWMARDW